ncbi:putative metal-binding motif-containing protein [Polyangium sp. 15x6]|uniref:putative metal-binding motif-containing protein n=1 Tax=Polyangium sp. 15x6 TaxID=3042687 RepID=UPI00249A1B44|nr:putative metal-binding motif-containing protein [Polyangium sp. 15x6]MDI3286895.1 putative metal-binding motif-containing protein [Polyangium sp. 15x6]
MQNVQSLNHWAGRLGAVVLATLSLVGAGCDNDEGNGPEGCAPNCPAICTPSSKTCNGTVVETCSADGQSRENFDCATVGLVCNEGACAPASTCGDGTCSGGETFASCPQDCEPFCQPGSKRCDGNVAKVCAADGGSEEGFDCATVGLVCNEGACAPASTCGDGTCSGGETFASCPQDCEPFCQPNTKTCEGNVAKVCAADGGSWMTFDCTTVVLVCSGGTCVVGGGCGDGACNGGETPMSCPMDCPSATCGDGVCGPNEPVACPQDCPSCVPGSKSCTGNVLKVCAPNGMGFSTVDCSQSGQVCGGGQCRPKDVCGNFLCESGEVPACTLDCMAQCGDGTCGAGESFDTCSADCPAQCGDGACNGAETPMTCAADCPNTCGDGTCDGAETRQSCPKDCGYCGDLVCQDGFESPSSNPPAPKVSCPQDCTVLTCATNADCNDMIACTTNVCSAGVCTYPPNNAACGASGKCLGAASTDPSGCCSDIDGDGYAAATCGGSDCNDGDPSIHPGALEQCDGVDRNCDGKNQPTLAPAVQVTSDFAFKKSLAVTYDGSKYLVAYAGQPIASYVLQYLVVDGMGSGTIQTTSEPADLVRTVYSNQKPSWGVAWKNGQNATMSWIHAAGTLSAARIPLGTVPTGLSFGWTAGSYLVIKTGNSSCPFGGCYTSNTGLMVSEASGVTEADPALVAASTVGAGQLAPLPLDLAVNGDTFVVLHESGTLLYLKADNTSPGYVTAQSTYVNKQSSSHTAWDGQMLVAVSKAPNAVQYERIASNGLVVSSTAVGTKSLSPVKVAVAPAVGMKPALVGVLATDGANFYFFSRSGDGSPALPVGLIGGGNTPTDGTLLWDGQRFVAFWLANVAGTQQVFMTSVTCQ